ncbi:MAG: serine hydrolase domain-containing protein [Spirochaetota bacterium]
MPFEEFLRSRIFVPLEMTNTGAGYFPSNGTRHAYGHGDNGTMLAEGLSCTDMGCGSGSMYSTVEDLFIWDRALYTEKLVSKSSLHRMFTRYNEMYGYGWWFMDTDRGYIPIHGGRLLDGSFSGFYVRDSEEDISFIILGNDGRHDEKRDFLFAVHAAIKKILSGGGSL